MTDPDRSVQRAAAAGRLHINRSSTAEQAADVLRDLILSRQVPGGEPLREMHLAEAIGVSRNTMREALRILAREGIISQDRHHIATVAEIHAQDVREIFAVRRLLETGAVEALRARGGEPDLVPMRSAFERLRRFRAEDPWMSVIDADRDFHVELVRLARNPRLDAVYARLESEIRLCLALTTRVEVQIEQIISEHARILGHLERGDHDGAIAELRVTMEAACGRVSRVLDGAATATATPSS